MTVEAEDQAGRGEARRSVTRAGLVAGQEEPLLVAGFAVTPPQPSLSFRVADESERIRGPALTRCVAGPRQGPLLPRPQWCCSCTGLSGGGDEAPFVSCCPRASAPTPLHMPACCLRVQTVQEGACPDAPGCTCRGWAEVQGHRGTCLPQAGAVPAQHVTLLILPPPSCNLPWHQKEAEPRLLRFTWNVKLTSTRSAEAILAALRQATDSARCCCRQTEPFVLSCTHEKSPSQHFCSFEVEVCRLQRLGGLHGVLFRRQGGTSLAFRSLVAKISDLLQL